MRVALASSDGKVVNQHFGRAEVFYILDIGEQITFVEARKTQPLCNDFGHDANALAASVALLGDCQAVFAAKVGVGAAQALFAAGLRVFEAPGAVLADIKEHLHEAV
ncbi:MAG: dinitrogenase iron-molybdenum cofactor biosynthesis protein [Oscillospiraceae bacterium]|jgi:predicted Fe-Mo cluster-binding NifX family protein|nr:dinitrogenase iron-molybdenum cofactor biosynthesis protein [Oscillospiraceae bacterium]